MTERLTVFGKISQLIIELVDQKVLEIIQTSDDLGLGLTSPNLLALCLLVNHSVLGKSYRAHK